LVECGVQFVENGNNAGDQSYQRLLSMINEEESKAVLGHSGSADSTPGKLGGESLAGEIRQDLVEADARGIEEDVGACLLAPFVRFNWGPDEPAPRMHLMVDALASKRETMSLAKEAWAMGLPVDREWLAASTGVQLTTDPAKQLPAPGPQGSAQTVAGINAPQPNALPIGGGQ
jgi:phage gp29-like protein